MKISEKFNLGLTQAYLDFVDIDLDTDLEVFVDPTALRDLESQWGHACASLVQQYFTTVLDYIKNQEHDKAKVLLSNLKERNEFHIGYSSGKSRGSAFGSKSADLVWDALCKSKAATTGLLKDLEDSCLLIEGVGRDMISDAVCNIIRPKLIEYTQDMCRYYGIPLYPNINSGPVWNNQTKRWVSSFVELPIADGQTFLLIPKNIVRRKISYDFNEYYRHYILEELRLEHIRSGSSLVYFLKNGAPRVNKKDLIKKYGQTKKSGIDQTIGREHIFEKYKSDKANSPKPPLSNEQLAEVQNLPEIDWDALINELKSIPKGKKHADAYEKTIEKILTALFYPNLNYPNKQYNIHNGRKRVDLVYNNESKSGFFHWLTLHYPSSFIFIECKNYTNKISNPEIDQLSGRFSLHRGKIGLLVFRDSDNNELLEERCKDTAQDERGFMIALSDNDIIQLIEDYRAASPHNAGIERNRYPLLQKKFNKLIN
ncbi:hypothetical protein [Acinetobacter baumannii]|uniref:hypothetical protein n=1 Tax=Acinetobacter baumannii TaxID=470 RepID=UPI00135FD61E|nr:hypothetical protein [Acinetobacter baumannii]MDC4688689.1 hypothetical protein [Acinetobacter baumannii]MDH2514292.1 hypothetical protein [Acinetobacter baumannii]CAA0264231.1 hypothetical protein ABKPCSM17A_03196 [Acinetobacter baumannii]